MEDAGREHRVGVAVHHRIDEMLRMARAAARHDGHLDKIRLLREFDATSPHQAEVPDPYYGDGDGFAEVFDLVDAACRGLLDHLTESYDLR